MAPVSSSAPGRGDCPASLDPHANYFQSDQDLYHTYAGASVTTAPPGNSFSGCSLLLGGQRLSPYTEEALSHHRSIWPAGWIWMVSRNGFLLVHVQMVLIFILQQNNKVIHCPRRNILHCSIKCLGNYNKDLSQARFPSNCSMEFNQISRKSTKIQLSIHCHYANI